MLGIGPYLADAKFTLADISVSTALAMWRGALGQALPDELTGYQERLEARPAFQRARARNS